MKKILTRTLFIGAFLFVANIAFADIWASVGCSGTDCQTCHLVALSNEVINFLLFYIAMPFAALVFAYAGFMLMFAKGNESKVSQAKSIFGYVFWGLIIALAAFLVIDSILKSLLTGAQYGVWNNVQCVAQPTYSASATAGPTSPSACGTGVGANISCCTPSELTAFSWPVLDDPGARGALAAGGVGVNKSACSCPTGGNCTNVGGWPAGITTKIVQFDAACDASPMGPCDTVVTGGTEPGHATHGVGLNPVDLRANPEITNFITTNGTGPVPRGDGCMTWTLSSGPYAGSYTLEDASCGYTPHWHVVF